MPLKPLPCVSYPSGVWWGLGALLPGKTWVMFASSLSSGSQGQASTRKLQLIRK